MISPNQLTAQISQNNIYNVAQLYWNHMGAIAKTIFGELARFDSFGIAKLFRSIILC